MGTNNVGKLTKRFKGSQKYVCHNDKMHPRSKHANSKPNFFHFMEIFPYLAPYVHVNRFNEPKFCYNSRDAISLLTKALFKLHYGTEWSLPRGHLVPTLPSRANYVHIIADHLARDVVGEGKPLESLPILKGSGIKGLDIGIGANAVYSLLSSVEYGWSMVGTDISKDALAHAQTLINQNKLEHLIQLKCQPDPLCIFQHVLEDISQVFAFCMCNPPFHSSESEVQQNPARTLDAYPEEIICQGGELAFISRMMKESVEEPFRSNIMWFTTLCARKVDIKKITDALWQLCPTVVKCSILYQGKHVRWVIAWSFTSAENRKAFFSKLTESLV